jgi:hypothetical protein
MHQQLHKSRSLSVIAALSISALTGCTPAAAPPFPSGTTPAITIADVKSRIYRVADDSMLGRAAGEKGNFMMTEYLASEAQRLGLEPGGENGTWFQVIPMVHRSMDSTSSITLGDAVLRPFSDFALIQPSTSVRFATSLPRGTYDAVYGGRAGDSSFTLEPSQVNGKILVFDAPIGANGQPSGTYSTAAASSIARYPGAAAIAISVIDLLSPAARTGMRRRGNGLSDRNGVTIRTPLGMMVTSAAADRMMGGPLATMKPGARGQTVTVDARFIETPTAAPARTVIAILRGSDPALRGEYVAVGAHSDHIGIAARAVDHDSLRAYNRFMRPAGADSRVARTTPATPDELRMIRTAIDSMRKLRPPRRDSINNGADDDGSGSVALLEMAESLASGKHPRRSILFVWHTAEEAGLLGSAWFTEHTTVPHDSIIAQLNMDMVGRGTERDTPKGGPRNIQVIGSRRLSTDLGNVVDSVNAASREPYVIDYDFDAHGHVQNRYCRSDHYMYARTGIPIAYLSRGYHQDYHLVTDEPQYVNYAGVAKVAGFVRDVAVALANRNDRVRVDKPRPNPLAACQQ